MYASELTTLDSVAELTLPLTNKALQHVFKIALSSSSTSLSSFQFTISFCHLTWLRSTRQMVTITEKYKMTDKSMIHSAATSTHSSHHNWTQILVNLLYFAIMSIMLVVINNLNTCVNIFKTYLIKNKKLSYCRKTALQPV